MARRRPRRSRLLRALVGLLGLVLLGTAGPVLVLRFIDPPASTFMLLDRYAAWRREDDAYRFRYEWTDWNEIAPAVKTAVVAAEDQKFADHSGFDFESIGDALRERERGRGMRGASTISQQVAKNLFLWPGRSWLRKAIEAWYTLLIETLWPKRRILEVYLNIAEFGLGTFGIGAAAERYFGKPASALDHREAARLAAVLPSPKRFDARSPSPYLLDRQQWILGQMSQLGGTAWPERLERRTDR